MRRHGEMLKVSRQGRTRRDVWQVGLLEMRRLRQLHRLQGQRQNLEINRESNSIKVIGGVIAVIIVLGGMMLSSAMSNVGGYGYNSGGIGFFALVTSLFWGGGVFLIFYVFGVLVSAQGQILKAMLDSAVNSSPFLNNEHRAKIMSLI